MESVAATYIRKAVDRERKGEKISNLKKANI